ncbi:MAG TPA: U32 family peptidase, partial [Saprospiraceae bacterium]|nr:U32 family peptidase [Saprospiraceae bacterium]
TKCYREAIDAYQNGSYSRENVANWEARLATVFNRGFWDGYYLGRKMGEWNDVYGSKATKRKIYIGKGIKFFEKASVAEFKLETHSLSVGDEIMVTGPTTGYIEAKVSEIRINDQPVEKVNRGEQFSIHLSEKIRPSDKLYKVVDA